MSQESFSSAIQYWKSIQLVGLQKELDQQGLAIVENQKDGLVSRKKLAEQTREFKKIPDEEKVSKFKPLLKGYQAEIDSITKRTKYAENAFLTVYKLLADAPDPVPLFEAAVDSSMQQEDTTALLNENSYLKEQLEQAKQSSKQLSTLEKTNEALVQKVAQLEETLNSTKAKKVDHLEQEMKDQYSDKIKQYKEREYDLQNQLNQALDQLTELKHSHDDTQAQLINHGQKYDEEVIGKLAELDMVTMDLERAHGRIAHLEKKNEDLKQEIAQLSGSQHDSKHENDQHNAEINKLIKDIETYKGLYQTTEARLTKKIKELNNETQALSEERDNLKKKMKKYEDYDEIKRELQIMKFVEFSTGEEDGDFNATDVLKKEAVQDSLEVQLMEKNKKLENDYTQVKMTLADLQKEFEEKTQKEDRIAKELQEKTALVQRLEEDVLRLGQQANNLSRGSMSPLHPKSPEGLLTPHAKDEKSILPIVMGQRDRFRQRNAELEERTRALETSLYDARTEIQNLKADNLKLYERLKFVHVWKEGELASQRSSVAVNMEHSESSNYPTRSFRRSSLKADDPSDKYGKLYEESMNPFTQFHKKEENRRYNALNPIEKMTLQLTRLLFSHKWSRYFFIVYSLLLHFLVVLTLYQLSLWECRHDHETLQFPTNNDGTNRILNGEV